MIKQIKDKKFTYHQKKNQQIIDDLRLFYTPYKNRISESYKPARYNI